ncbi:hypothetical protein [Archangium sp.]|uniref:hypothetical protein n=1 Tax=Archangium sp. TaxID=1872627 RepID=UPI00389AB8EE
MKGAARGSLARDEASHPLALLLEVGGHAAAVSPRDEKYLPPLEKAHLEVFRQE